MLMLLVISFCLRQGERVLRASERRAFNRFMDDQLE